MKACCEWYKKVRPEKSLLNIFGNTVNRWRSYQFLRDCRLARRNIKSGRGNDVTKAICYSIQDTVIIEVVQLKGFKISLQSRTLVSNAEVRFHQEKIARYQKTFFYVDLFVIASNNFMLSCRCLSVTVHSNHTSAF